APGRHLQRRARHRHRQAALSRGRARPGACHHAGAQTRARPRQPDESRQADCARGASMTARRPRAAAAALAVLLLFAGAAAGSELSDDLQARRARVMERLGPDAMLLVWSAPVQRYSADVNYEYRQDSNLYYLTGL